ncbi:uncharacterized protein YegL [Catalinimonas alkaloidigena]|uniref:vWA domain-containing protein n=1 Tax=Catalinimonas alkaloidigena TaxID=1075417 RepID=UPI002405FBAF|nr:VWA domain-containing protein [Catalinimonas alkaloidigena]MDF9800549.1 uncharacterized protein YegL [Catalinimonas alkaloidigena]
MAYNDFSAESPENYEQKCLCVLVLDVSFSMQGNPIDELQKGLEDFYSDILEDSTTANRLEVSIITFGSNISILIEPSLAENFSVPNLTLDGSTKLVDGVREGIAKVEDRKQWYKDTGQPYYRPWVILITDGEPDSDQDVDGLSKEIRVSVENKKFFFFAIGVEGANMDTLKKISSTQMPPSKLQGLKFSEFFKWLSASMTIVTSSKDGDQVNLPSPEDWMTGFKV